MMNRRREIPASLILWLFLLGGSLLSCESALEQLSGFDTSRLEGCYPLTDSASVSEMAKLLYRVDRLSEGSMESRLSGQNAGESSATGEVIEVEGEVVKIRAFRVPEKLVEFLEMSDFREVWIDTPAHRSAVYVKQSPGGIAIGDRVKVFAFQIGDRERTDDANEGRLPLVARKLSWFPANPDSVGWTLLGEQGVDLSLLSELPKRNRLSLKADDNAFFYAGMQAADELRKRPAGTLPTASDVGPIDLLKSPQNFHGEWIALDLKTIRITRVAVERASHQEALGQPYYWQVDASGDLGKTVIQLTRDEGDPIQLSGYYPVTLVSKSLPKFLQSKVEEGVVVALIDEPVRIEGFFVRLWSYENEFMQQQDAGKQVAPLLIASLWKSTLVIRQSSGVEVIGYGLAVFVTASILGTLWWTRRNAIKDRAAKTLTEAPTVEIELP
ncbi:MAG: hypothetical protein AAF802_14670 [Planctomycetota bacterium]